MLTRIVGKPIYQSSEIISADDYKNRRQILRAMGLVLTGGTLSGLVGPAVASRGKPLEFHRNPDYRLENLTDFEDLTEHNNFFEFGSGKRDPARYASLMPLEPWQIEVTGLAAKTGHYDLWKLISRQGLEERIYRFRCVERWAMVVPWIGIPLSSIINALEPLSDARFVSFQSLADPKVMPGLGRDTLQWPFVEGLRLDEALHPLTFVAVGLHGQMMPPQNGAPVRLVVPWKYGYKSIKSIVRIGFESEMPPTSWNRQSPEEYGFYSNVNPDVDHPRWSQKKERLLGGGLFSGMRKTELFNGYADEVASLYSGMDLSVYR